MGYVVKHSSGDVNKARKKGNVALGVDADGYDKTSVSGFYAGVAPVPGFHNLVRTSASTDPDFYTLTDLELVNFANSLGGSVSDVTGAKVYLASRNDIMFTDEVPESTVTDSLVLELDPSNLSSYPRSGSTIYDLSGGGNNGTLTNGPTYDPEGSIVLDGTNDYIDLGTPGLISGDFSISLWAKKDSGKEHYFFTTGYNSSGTILIYSGGTWLNSSSTDGRFPTTFSNSIGEIFNVTITRTGSTAKLYKNSELISTLTYSGNISTSGRYLIGWAIPRNKSTAYHEGNFYGLKMYDKGLSEDEVKQNYYKSDIVTNGLILNIDPNNIVSYNQTGSTFYNLTDTSVSASLVNGAGSGDIISLDGTNDWIGVNNSVTSTTLSPSVATFSIWFRANDTYSSGNKCSLISRGNYNRSGGFFIHMENSNGNCRVSATFSNSTTNSYSFQGVGATTVNGFGEWNCITVTVDDTVKLYANGELKGTQARSVSNIIYGNGTINTNGDTNLAILSSLGYAPTLDQGSGGTWRPFNGDFGNMQMYNRVLSPDEVLQNYNAQKARFTNPDPTLETDGEWLKIFRQYSGDGDFFSSSNDWAEAKRTNADNPQANKYSILDTLYRYKMDGKFTLKINYPSNGITNIWSQTNNPVRDDGSGGVTGYTAIDIDTTASGWGGLERYDAQNSTFLDGTLSPQSNWFYAIGSKAWSTPTTFPGHNTPVNEVELWVKYK